MWQTMALTLLGGVIAGNGLPHFLRGITRRRYPCAFGNGPIPNLVAGWPASSWARSSWHWPTWTAIPPRPPSESESESY